MMPDPLGVRMADRTIKVKLQAQVDDFNREINRSAQSLDALAKKAGDSGAAKTQAGRLVQSARLQTQAWTSAGTAVAAVGAAVTGIGALAVREFATFDQAMSGVASTGADAKNNIEALREAAITAGADTAFSATEAAQGLEELARAGVSADDSLSGGLTGALDLAAAGQIAVADAAGIASTAMQQFALSGQEVPHVADLLAAGAGKAMGGVDELGAALKQSGLVASQFGLSIEETVGGLSAFASAGLLGSDAGTSFKSMLLALANPAGKSAKLMSELGINAYDAQGKFIGLEGLAGQLQSQLSGLTEAQRQQTLAQIFGTDAIRAASILYEEGAEGIAEWTAAVDDSGYAARTAAELQDNLVGDLEKLGGAWSSLAIQMGEAANGPLRGAVQHLTGIVDIIGALPEPVLQTGAAIGGIAGAAALGAGGLMFLLPRTLETVSAFRELGMALPGVEGKIRGVGKAATVAAGLIATLQVVEAVSDYFQAAAPVADDYAAALTRVANSSGDLNSLFGDGIKHMMSAGDVSAVASAMKTYDQYASDVIGRFLGVNDAADDVLARFKMLDASLASSSPEVAAAGYRELQKAQAEAGWSAEKLHGMLPEYAAKLNAAAAAAGMAELSHEDLAKIAAGELPAGLVATEAGILSVAEASKQAAPGLGDMTAEMQASQEAAEEYLKMLEGYADADASFISLMDAWQSVAEKAAEASESADDSWQDFYDGQSLALSDYIAELEEQVKAQSEWETNMVLLAGRASDGLIEHLASLGPEGAPLVAALVNGTDAELAQMETLFAQRGGEATGAFAEELATADAVWAALAQKGGASAVAAAAAEFAAGKTTLQGIIDSYDLTATLNANTDPAIRSVQATIARINGMSATVQVRAYHANGLNAPVATGGYVADVARAYGLADGGMPRRWTGQLVHGPGTTTSDEVPARLSRDEFVQRAAAVGYYGVDAMYRLNSAQADRGAVRAALGLANGGTPAQPTPQMLRLPTPAPINNALSLSDGDVARIAAAVRAGAADGTHAGIAARTADARIDAYRGL